MKTVVLRTPLSAENLLDLRCGDKVELTGSIYTARDAAHGRFLQAVRAGEPLPVNLDRQIIFYAGPCPAKPGSIIGPIAPTTSVRMDGFLEMCYKLGVQATIGKGGRTESAAELCKKYKRVYFLSYGGAAALISRCVKKNEPAAYEDLGTEAVQRLEVEKMLLIIGIDSKGNVFESSEIAKYRRESA